MTDFEEMRQKAACRRAMIMAAIIQSNRTTIAVQSKAGRNELIAIVNELERGIN
jgi:hypothetical protein